MKTTEITIGTIIVRALGIYNVSDFIKFIKFKIKNIIVKLYLREYSMRKEINDKSRNHY